MVFSTHSGNSRPREAGSAARRWPWGWRAAWVCGWLVGLLLALGVRAEAPERVRLERTPEGLYLSARMPLNLSDELQDALARGVPLHFVWQAELRRTRWYWTDKRLGGVTRAVRLVYQPLTRRWRVSLGSAKAGEPGPNHALHQNVDSLDEALAVAARVRRWQVAQATDLADGGADKLDVQLHLESALLPRVFQTVQTGRVEVGWSWQDTLDIPTRTTPWAPTLEDGDL